MWSKLKSGIWTVPNALTLLRILLIPPIIWLYVSKNYIVAIILIIISAVSDVLDGIIARKFNQISEFGKIIDPIADKLTQGAILICLTSRYKYLWSLIVLFVVKEITVGVFGLITVNRSDIVTGSKWYGKLCTTIVLSILGALVFFPMITDTAAYIMGGVCAAALIFSFIMYLRLYIGLIRKKAKEKNGDQISE